MRKEVDLREAINAVSDVVQNRPRPLRAFDQIHMKTGDMVMQAEIVADWADGGALAFIGDGDAISVSVALLMSRGILDYGPTQVTVFDFDERVVNAIERFADKERITNLNAQLYNVLDVFPRVSRYDFFYTNPPWGASNDGESVHVFTQRGIEAIGYDGDGMIVIADDEDLDWPKQVLHSTQRYASERGFYVSKMTPRVHLYHLDDAPDLKSCNLVISSLPGNSRAVTSEAVTDPERLQHFYGKSKEPKVRYVRERKRLDYGRAHEDEYELEMLQGVE